ncbi:MAG TPA: translation initiation factor IF-2 [Polyangiaceae bacterium]
MSKVRVYEAAKQLNVDPKAAVSLFQAAGIADVKNHMSSVEPEAIERVRRHLEKAKTHDVVEERIRPTVVKRRAVAKPGGVEHVSSPHLPAPPPSMPAIVDSGDTNGHTVVARDRESGRLPEIPQERKSTREVAVVVPPPPPSSRKSSRGVGDVAAKAERKSTKSVPRLPEDQPSAPAIAPPPPPSVHDVAPPPPVVVAAPVAEPVAVVAAPPPPPPPPPPPVREVVAPQEPPQRMAPKTGVEYWGGRPGVPMPTPASAQRTAIGGGPASAMPRRVQYDPRSSASTVSRPGVRPGMQGGRPMGGRPMGGRPGGRPGQYGSVPMRTRGGPVSTQEMSAHKKVIRIEENITLSTMASKMSLKATELLMKLIGMGMTGVHINTTLDADTAKILASEFGWEVEDVAISEEESIAAARGEEAPVKDAVVIVDESATTRPPVVTVMGHVDHGKTSLLDKIRKANVAGGEAGGITQHIGAYKVKTPNGTIVFLDTPGHEAFTQMRARGASVTDIVVLVVAADDGVMPQTKEAVAHAKLAKVPIIVAVNKIDKPGAEPERVKRELVELGLQPEDWGGDTMFVNVSAMTGEGIPQLLEAIGLQAEVMELNANPQKSASGTVLEALLDRGRGPVARILVQDGTLKVGDFVLAGPGFGKVRAMTNEHGKQIHEAGPATPVEILGLSEVPGAGDPLHAVKDSKKAQEIAESRKGKMAKSLIPATAKVSLEELSKRISELDQQELRVIIKGDVQGSVEAVADVLAKLSCDRVRLSIIHAGVGAITEGDINLAIAARAIVIGFNVRPAGKAGALAEENDIEIRTYSIIYAVIDDVRSAMEGLLPATLVERINGRAEARQIFKIKGQVVAGSYVVQGVFKRAGQVRVIREGNVVYTGKVSQLKRFKDDVKDVAEGFECGISVDGWTDLKELDILESFDVDEVKQKL